MRRLGLVGFAGLFVVMVLVLGSLLAMGVLLATGEGAVVSSGSTLAFVAAVSAAVVLVGWAAARRRHTPYW